MSYGGTEHQNGIVGQGDGRHDRQQKENTGLAKRHEESIGHVSAANDLHPCGVERKTVQWHSHLRT